MELVGHCVNCGKEVYCSNGFLAGSVDEQHRLYCLECSSEQKLEDRKKPTK